MREVLRLVPRRQASLAVLLGAGAVLTGAGLLATSGALITGASMRPESLLVLMPMITCVRLFAVSRAALRYAERMVSHDLTLRLVGRLRASLLERLVPLAPAALVGARGGELLARVRTDVDELQGVFVRLLAPTAVAVLAGGVAVGLTSLVSQGTALVLAVLLVVLGVAVPVASRHLGKQAAVATAREETAVGADVLDLVRGLSDHLSSDGGRTALAALDGHLDRQQGAERRSARVTAATTVARDGVPSLGVVAALWLVGTEVAAGRTNPLLLAAAALGVLGAFEAVAGLGAAWGAADRVQAAAQRVRSLVELPAAVTDPVEPTRLPPAVSLQFEHVTFTYPGARRPALTRFSLHASEGDHIALSGPSGAGKSSVLALALRVYDPDEGAVRLGGFDLRDLSLEDLRRRFAWAPQVPQLLGGTLAGNVRLGCPEASEAELVAVLHELGLGELVRAVGLHGWIGEAGERLSAGERARVALARALLSPAPVLLLDEPTAHLDATTAHQVLDVLAQEERTMLLVTHTPAALDGRWRQLDLSRALS